ncbi:MAG: TerC family protein [Rhabdochlamydiaceae bacterium]
MTRSTSSELKKSICWSLFWVFSAFFFNGYVIFSRGLDSGVQFFTGYLLEKSLSIDNVFVFMMIFRSMNLDRKTQHQVLNWGIIGAFVFRFLLIFFGLHLVHQFKLIFYLFGGILLFSGVKICTTNLEEKVEEPSVIKVLRTFPKLKSLFDKGGGYRLLISIFFVEIADLIFALDSIPVILSVSQDFFIVYTSNLFAILGLRSLYFVVAEMASRFYFIQRAVGYILIFIGCKFFLMSFIKISPIFTLLVLTVIFGWSYIVNKKTN